MKIEILEKIEVFCVIDIKKAKEEFKEYVKNYDIENPKIALKVAHIERVSIIAKNIAESLKLSKEDIELAELIGLLHDIGRFEQVKRYNTFVDAKSINHAKLGVDILFKEGLIRKFIEDEKYDKIIEVAIVNHDKYKMPEGLDKEELLFSKIIRDADKLDILYEGVEIYWNTIKEKENVENSKMSVKIGQLLKVERPVRKMRK